MAGAFLVVRIKGQADVPHWARTTLKLLRLEKKYRATIIKTQENTSGMLEKVKHYVSWQELDAAMARELLDKKGRKPGYKKLTESDLADSEYKTFDDLAGALADGKTSLSRLSNLKPWFALSPPRHGFKRSTKRLYGQKGILGHNAELFVIVRRMMG